VQASELAVVNVEKNDDDENDDDPLLLSLSTRQSIN